MPFFFYVDMNGVYLVGSLKGSLMRDDQVILWSVC